MAKSKINITSLLKIIIPLLSLTLIFIFALMFIKNKNASKKDSDSFMQYTIKKDDKQIDATNNGLVKFSFGNRSYTQTWDKEDVLTLYKYIKSKGKKNIIFLTKGDYIVVVIYEEGNKITLYLPADDPEMENIFKTIPDDGGENSTGGGNGDGSGDNGDGIFDFSTSTPVPTSAPSGGGIVIIPAKPDDCPLWLLSWCVYPHPSPTPIIPNPTPNSSVTPDCSYWLKDVQDKAIISNTFCLKPSPTP